MRLSFLFVLFTSTLLAQQPALPTTPQGRIVAEYLRAFNSGDENVMKEFFLANAGTEALKDHPVEMRLERYRSMRQDLQSLDLLRLVPAAAGEITILARARNNDLLTMTFEFEGEKLSAIGVERGDRPQEPSGPPLAHADGIAELRRTAEEAAGADRFSGAVFVARDTAVLLQQAYGLADKRLRVANRIDTKFNLGSINKLFTRICIGQLAAAGRLSLTDRLIKILPDYPNRGIAERITIAQLLEMRSGMGDIFGEKFDKTPKDQLRKLRDYLPFFADAPLLFEPGTQRRYSNAGYIVLGLVIEKLSGTDYYRYVRKNICSPAGMENTDWYEMDAVVPNIATGYDRSDSAWKSNIYSAPAKGSSAGGGYSTIGDLRNLLRALTAGTILDARYSQWIFTGELPQEAPSLPLKFGNLGVAGGAPGINADIEFDARTGNMVIVLGNYSPPAASDVAKALFGILKRMQ